MSDDLKIGCLIPIRLSSERLPGKAMMEICGVPVVHHLLNRISQCRRIKDKKDIIVCTTTAPSDDPLAKSVEAYGASVFRGSIDDIIDRFYNAAEAFSLDVIIQVDGDDPLCDHEYMDLCAKALIEDQNIDVAVCDGLPLGIASKAFTKKAMDQVFKSYKTAQNDTGFAYFFTKSGLFNIAHINPITPEHIQNEARLTLDYQVDLDCFTQIFEKLYPQNPVFSLKQTVNLLNERPDILSINAGLNEEYYTRTTEKAVLDFKDANGQIQRIKV